MANKEHLKILKQGTFTWNQWRKEHYDIIPDLSWAELQGKDLSKVDFSKAYLRGAKLGRVNISGATLWKADLAEADLSEADLCQANLRKANLFEANLTMAKLNGANLTGTLLVDTNLRGADLTGCFVYGCSIWSDKPEVEGAKQLEGAIQSGLIIVNAPGSHNWKPESEKNPPIKVDSLKLAQFIHLLLDNETIREVIDTTTTKAVLILGRFTPERKAVLDAIREELRKQNYVPILFDFDVPSGRDITETVTLLARMARFIIADLTDPSSIPKELEAIVPTLAIPVKPLLEGLTHPYSMFKDYWKYDWILEVYRYRDLNDLLASLKEKVITPAELKLKELQKKRNEARQ